MIEMVFWYYISLNISVVLKAGCDKRQECVRRVIVFFLCTFPSFLNVCTYFPVLGMSRQPLQNLG